MKQKFYSLLIILALVLCCVSCKSQTDDKKQVELDLSAVNVLGIKKEIQKSSMMDGGYRFANMELKDQISVYATYYIRSAKKSAHLISRVDNLTDQSEKEIINKFMDTSKLDLTDIFCTVSLINNKENISAELKKKISQYFDSLYDEDIGCYLLPYSDKKDIYNSNAYPNFLVKSIASLLEIKIKPIDNWMKKATKNIFSENNITIENSGAYVMFYKLLQLYDMELPKKSIELVQQMFEESLNNISELKDSNKIYFPVYLMDYLEFSLLTNVDSSYNYSKITNSLCNKNGIEKNILIEYDAYGLYAIMHTLELVNYNFKDSNYFKDVFDSFDDFLIDDSCYITPGNVESNFMETYYVDAIINILNIDRTNNITLYCKTNKNNIIQSGALNTYYFLELLQRNDLLEIIDDRQEIIDMLSATLKSLLSKEEFSIHDLSIINGSLKSLKILGEAQKISVEEFHNIVNNFIESDNIQQNIYNLSELIDFIHISYPNKKNMIRKYCEQLEKELLNFSKTEQSNKVMLQSKALYVLKKCDYPIIMDLKHIIKDTVNKAYDDSGLFKGGDTDEDLINFSNTYYAIILHKLMKEDIHEQVF